MATTTTNLGLKKPAYTDDADIQDINDNMDIIDQAFGDLDISALRPVPFAVAVADWASSGNDFVANFTSAYVTEACVLVNTYFDQSIVTYGKAHIFVDKKTGGGGLTLTTSVKPTGTVTGTAIVCANNDGTLPVIIEGTVTPIANGGTGQSSLAGAQEVLGITALTGKIENLQIAKVTGTMASSVDTYAASPYPSGFNGSNCVVIGCATRVSNGTWYSNNPSVTCMADTSNGIRIKSSETNFTSQPFVVLLMKLPS